MGETLAGLRTDADGRIAYATVTRDDIARTGAIPQDTEDLVDFTVSLDGVEVGLLFIEQARGGIKLSLRSRDGLDCARLAGGFGGGGHRAAAGAILPEPLAESVERVLAAVREALAAEAPAGPPSDRRPRPWGERRAIFPVCKPSWRIAIWSSDIVYARRIGPADPTPTRGVEFRTSFPPLSRESRR